MAAKIGNVENKKARFFLYGAAVMRCVWWCRVFVNLNKKNCTLLLHGVFTFSVLIFCRPCCCCHTASALPVWNHTFILTTKMMLSYWRNAKYHPDVECLLCMYCFILGGKSFMKESKFQWTEKSHTLGIHSEFFSGLLFVIVHVYSKLETQVNVKK